jgi:hypothetical protein
MKKSASILKKIFIVILTAVIFAGMEVGLHYLLSRSGIGLNMILIYLLLGLVCGYAVVYIAPRIWPKK